MTMERAASRTPRCLANEGGTATKHRTSMRLSARHGFWRCLAAAVLATALPGCSRTVTWEEEVPLNTGETIWIQRSMPWTLKGGFGNPFDLAMRPTREQVIRFKYGGKEYSYAGRANVLWIAIAPNKQPVLVAPAADFGWDSENNFYCAVPHYVQLVPDPSGHAWTWPPSIEPWLHAMPANLMNSIPLLDEARKARYSKRDREIRDSTYRLQVPAGALIEPTYRVSGCTSRS